MRLYAATPGRRALQIVGDLLFVLWIVLWVWVGNTVHERTMALTSPGERIDSSATELGDSLASAGGVLQEVPYVGDTIASPFDRAEAAALEIAAAGASTVTAVESLAFWLRLALILSPCLVWAAFYLPPRWAFIRRASAGQRFVDDVADLDLFALRALSNQPLHVLAKVSPDPAGEWRAHNPQVIRQLALLELESCGLRPP